MKIHFRIRVLEEKSLLDSCKTACLETYSHVISEEPQISKNWKWERAIPTIKVTDTRHSGLLTHSFTPTFGFAKVVFGALL